ncbi:Prokineticin receptor 2 [Trichoplax sp. H2]|nr:Prokineticin receptor 2 [Trichoplax sp. H2]|eukprot:RDD36502.1 Prokineticin receptor 2 [Trichoplax sp. H2]
MANSSGNVTFQNTASVTCLPIGFMGIITNFFLFIILLTNKSLRDHSYRIVASVIASDFFSSIQFVFVFLGPYFLEYSTFNTSQIYCKFLIYSMYSTYYASVLSLTAVSFYRYKLVFKASQIRFKEIELRKINKLLAIIWAISFLFAVPMIFFVRSNFTVTSNCDINYIQGYPRLTFTYFLCTAIVMYVLPLTTMVFNYVRLIRKLNEYILPWNNRIDNAIRRRDHVIRILLAVTSAFMLFNFPLFICINFMVSNVQTYYMLRFNNFTLYFISLLTLPITASVSLINPIIFITLDKNISKAVK